MLENGLRHVDVIEASLCAIDLHRQIKITCTELNV